MSTAAARAARAARRRQNTTETEEPTVQQPPPPPPPPFDLDKVAKKFKNLGGVPFTGSETVVQAQAWLKNCEKIFGGLGLDDQRKRFTAAWHLQGEAQNWWEVVNIGGDEDNMSWDRFKELFNDKYIPRQEVERLHDEFSYNNSYQASLKMAPFEALYDKPCRSPACWIEKGDRLVLGPDMVREASDKVDKIKKRLLAAQSRQKSYADKRRRDLQFSVGDHVYLKVSPLRGVIRFGKFGKLAPRFIGPFPILERIGTLAYRVQLPDWLPGVHDVFHVSQLRQHVHDPDLIEDELNQQVMDITPSLTVRKEPIKIIGKETRALRNKRINLVKVQWSGDPRDCTWETEESFKKAYPKCRVDISD